MIADGLLTIDCIHIRYQMNPVTQSRAAGRGRSPENVMVGTLCGLYLSHK